MRKIQTKDHWLITGTTSGIGLALRKTLCNRGLQVSGFSRNAIGTPDTGDFRCDISVFEDCYKNAKHVVQERGAPVVVVLSAGVLQLDSPFSGSAQDRVREMFQTNSMGCLHVINAFHQAAGHIPEIILISTVLIERPRAPFQQYIASKKAAESIIQAFNASTGISSFVARVGRTKTELFTRAQADEQDKITQERGMDPDSVAQRILHLWEQGETLATIQ